MSCRRRAGSAASASTCAANSCSDSASGAMSGSVISPAVLAQELPGRLLVFCLRLATAEPSDGLQQRLVFSKRFLVAELLQRDQAGGPDVIIVRLVEQDLARVLLELVGLEGMQRRRRNLPVRAQFLLVAQHFLEDGRRLGVGCKKPERLALRFVVRRLFHDFARGLVSVGV